jgi:hypothetical protein
MLIVYNLPHVFEPGATRLANARALRALLDCSVALNRAYLADNSVAPLYRSGVVYGRTNDWLTIPAMLQQGFADCKSLAPWYIAEKLAHGEDARPVFRWVKNPDGTNDFHILVHTADGVEDPSRVLGMGRHENART